MNKTYLTPEKQALIAAFIVKAAMANASFEYSSSFGKIEPQTAQQLLHTNPTTLKKVGEQLEKVVATKGASRFNKSNRLQIPAHSGIFAEEWLDFIELCLERQEAITNEKKTAEELREIEAELENLETPDEKKQKLLKKKAQLLNLTPETPVA